MHWRLDRTSFSLLHMSVRPTLKVICLIYNKECQGARVLSHHVMHIWKHRGLYLMCLGRWTLGFLCQLLPLAIPLCCPGFLEPMVSQIPYLIQIEHHISSISPDLSAWNLDLASLPLFPCHHEYCEEEPVSGFKKSVTGNKGILSPS